MVLPMPWRLARCLVQYPPRPAWSYALSGSCSVGRFLSWTQKIPSTDTIQCIVFRSDAATSSRRRAPTQVGPRPSDADSDWACHSDRPAPTNGRADALPPPGPGVSSDPRGHGPHGTRTSRPSSRFTHFAVNHAFTHGPIPNGNLITFLFLIILCCTATTTLITRSNLLVPLLLPALTDFATLPSHPVQALFHPSLCTSMHPCMALFLDPASPGPTGP